MGFLHFLLRYLSGYGAHTTHSASVTYFVYFFMVIFYLCNGLISSLDHANGPIFLHGLYLTFEPVHEVRGCRGVLCL